MRNLNCQILSGPDTSTQTGKAVDTNQLFSASFQSIFGDLSAAGTVKIQASNDEPPAGNMAPFTPTNWSDIPSATSTIASGVGPIITLASINYKWIRAIYTSGSGGSSTVIVNMNAQGF